MMRTKAFLICVFILTMMAACGSQPDSRNLSGAQLLQKKCKRCHSYKRAYTVRMTRHEWTKTIHRMWEREPSAMTKEEVNKIIEYLVEKQGTGG